MAPEYAMQGIFSVKSDVYSFGVIVLEIVSGRKNNSFHQIEGSLDLVEHVWELWNEGCALEIMDPTLRASCIADQVQRCIHVGLLCVENHAVDRPTIEDVILMLKNETSSVSMPKNPAFITRNSIFDEVETSRSEKLFSSASEITEVQGR
ncbi:UNVERIFIED_CONTAM: G-type lectin S-receptor-like serine/threonine-protein kinase [Sesamum radiatum]|uniref:G-type lectin S-receptor-like serine/threonine-protein kinase n=1 Tax=Sesamum radiatum TaxID=300843 RepID=A0AAW2L2B8_SESRA